MSFGKKSARGFSEPATLPSSGEERLAWQQANQAWWQNNPMRYDWNERIDSPEFSTQFYDAIDRRFFQNVREFMPWRSVPFDPLIDFDRLRGQDVLEIGVGNGSHAGLLAAHAQSFVGIDITDYAVESTSTRLRLSDLRGTVLKMDAERMSFADNSFDFVWSWGVIHHSSDTRQVLREIRRVLRPGGRVVTMVYHRSFWNFYVVGGLIHGFFLGKFFKGKSLHEIVQDETDGAIARYYPTGDWRALAGEFFDVDEIRVFGSKMEVLPLPAGRFKQTVARVIPSHVTRFLTNKCRFGSFLVSSMSTRP